MKKLLAALVCAVAFQLTVSAESYTYTPGDTSLGNGAVTITYDGSTTDIATLTANPSDGETITLTGGAATFAAGATITLASSGTVAFAEKVTTKGALTLARGDDVYRVWTGAALTTDHPNTPAFPDIVTNDQISATDVANTWECIHVVASAPSTSGYNHLGAVGRYDTIGGRIGNDSFVTLNRNTSAFAYSIRVQLTPRADGTYARCRTGVRSPRYGLYPDLEKNWATADLWGDTVANWGATKEARAFRGIWGTSDSNGNDAQKYGGTWLGYTSAMGLNKIILRRKNSPAGAMQVRFDGGATLGGTTTIPFGMEAVLSVGNGSDSSVLSQPIEGDGDFRIKPIDVGSATSYREDYREDFITTSWSLLVQNRLLASVTSMSAEMNGSSQPTSVAARWCHYKYDPATDMAKCQFQFWNGTGIKVVKVELRQQPDNSGNIQIRATGAGYYTGTQYNYNNNEPVDVYDRSNTHTVATNATVANYGIHKIRVTTSDKGGIVTVSGNVQNLIGGRFTVEGGDSGRMIATVTSTTGLPAGGAVHINTNAELRLMASTTAPANGTFEYFVHAGGRLRNINQWQISRPQNLVFDGGTFSGYSTDAYLNYVTLSNANMNGTYTRVAYDLPNAYWRVIGTAPSTIAFSSGLNAYGYAGAATARNNNCAFRIEVADVTDGPDCILNRIRGAANRGASDRESYAWFWFEKYGPGTLKITDDSKEVRMESRLYNGTLLLAGNNIMTNEVQLLGGNLAVDAGKANNNLGQLTAEKGGTITVGAGGSLGFASFAPGANLATKSIMIDAPKDGNVLKFNTTFTGEQLRYFRWKDETAPVGSWRVAQDADGYMHPVECGTFIFIR
ncbi:MAG: hypothetical protein IJH50_02840 [Kiritimatiellae bacterium]|nr:hypothetical protein [Kiritimatiellia bacterium]